MTRAEPLCNSEESVAWHAHREAETISDPSVLEELGESLLREKNKKRRQAVYFMLGHLGARVRGSDCARLLLSQASKETDKYVLSSLLEALQRIPKAAELDLTPVFELLHDERWQVRHSAIQALAHSESPEAEDRLLDLLRATSDPYDITYCQGILNKIGTAKAIPLLEKNLKSRKRDVKGTAQFAIEAIKRREAAKR